MNAILELVVIAAIVGVAALFVALRVLKALRGGRPSCCSDAGETGRELGQRAGQQAGQQAGMSSCADSDGTWLAGKRLDEKGSDGKPRPRPSYCAGCTGCGPHP